MITSNFHTYLGIPEFLAAFTDKIPEFRSKIQKFGIFQGWRFLSNVYIDCGWNKVCEFKKDNKNNIWAFLDPLSSLLDQDIVDIELNHLFSKNSQVRTTWYTEVLLTHVLSGNWSQDPYITWKNITQCSTITVLMQQSSKVQNSHFYAVFERALITLF